MQSPRAPYKTRRRTECGYCFGNRVDGGARAESEGWRIWYEVWRLGDDKMVKLIHVTFACAGTVAGKTTAIAFRSSAHPLQKGRSVETGVGAMVRDGKERVTYCK